MTGQHLLLLIWTLWLVFALLSIGDLVGVILALVFGLLSLGLISTGLATWRGYVIAWLIVHVLVAGYALAVFREWLRPASGRLGLRTVWNWPQSPSLQMIFGSASSVGLASVIYLRPTVPWKYSVDIPLMLLVVAAVVGVEYALLPVSWRAKYPVTPKAQVLESDPQDPEPGPQDPEPDPQVPEPDPQDPADPAGPELGADLALTNGDTMEGKVVTPEQPPNAETENRKRISGLDFRLGSVENYLFLHQQAERAQVSAPSALESKPSDPPVWFQASDEVRFWAESDELASGEVRVELLRIARLTARQEGSNAKAGRVVGITIEHGTVPVSLEPHETVSQVTTKAAETLRQVIGTWAAPPDTAQGIRPPVWGVVSERWVKPGSVGVSIAAKTVNDFGADLDNVLYDRPVQRVFSWDAPGSPGSAAAVIGRDAETMRILHFGGIVVGTRSGRPVAVRACFRSPERDEFTRSLAAGIARELDAIGLYRTPTPVSKHMQATSAPVGY